jgi:hypothetical protein
MKVQQLISAGFAITALAAASVPAVGWTLLGEVDRPTPSMQASWQSPPLFEIPARSFTVALRMPGIPDPADARNADAGSTAMH